MALDTPAVPQPIGRLDRLLAPPCLTVATWLLRLRFRHVLAIAQWAKRRCPQQASAAQATGVNAAIRLAGRYRPHRVACMEVSLATVLLAATQRRSVDWCIGARLMPYAAHAWIEVDGIVVGEPDTRDRPYHVLRRA
ncbi:lasso peptide biosynthesis B2 protein [Lentzea tibetensis]|uniref:Lasso peptide biosynthesis B2 protein n=2 Tax=Lentzea tibetensis TaxID=2591470 RepID=A0A563EHJ6_9PSEU|nr:lasso peptide biosynthesis B2 protein [Lentzea tibetensis]